MDVNLVTNADLLILLLYSEALFGKYLCSILRVYFDAEDSLFSCGKGDCCDLCLSKIIYSNTSLM